MSIYDKALKGLLRKCLILRFKNYEEFEKIVSTLSNDEIEWLKELSKNNPYAQFNLGYMYYLGLRVKTNYKEAVRLLRLSADQGNSEAQNKLGNMYHVGLIVKKDNKEAVRYYRSSAEQDNALGQKSLGYMYYHGLGVEKDNKEAVRLFHLAADQGNSDAKCYLNRLSNKLI